MCSLNKAPLFLAFIMVQDPHQIGVTYTSMVPFPEIHLLLRTAVCPKSCTASD